jgi:CheY-like chemotaxis protein
MVKVLVVEDNEDLRSLLEATLRREGFEVLAACDGDEALQVLGERRVDIIVTDLFMPERDGVETIVAIREKFPGLQIIAMSGWQSSRGPDYLAVAREIGAAATLRKPFEPPELVRIVRRLALERGDSAGD